MSSVHPLKKARRRGAEGAGLWSHTCLPTTVPAASSLSLSRSLSRLHPHTHTILALLIQGKERLMFSARTGHHKLFFLNRRKKHPLTAVTSSPLSSLVSSSVMQSPGLWHTTGHEGPQQSSPSGAWRHTRLHCSGG